MIKFEHFEVMNFENAIRGMRNPLNSWEKSDTVKCNENCEEICERCAYQHDFSKCQMISFNELVVGPSDLALAQKLANAGSDHRKFLRQIFVSMDITAPLYWWKEFDTYKVGTTANSCSTMHTIHKEPITSGLFSIDAIEPADKIYINYLEHLRQEYLETKNKEIWRALIQRLPSSFNQLRTCTLNYEVLRNMYHNRNNHKLDEWHNFCKWAEGLPYAKELILGE